MINRREFLQRSGVAAVATAVPAGIVFEEVHRRNVAVAAAGASQMVHEGTADDALRSSISLAGVKLPFGVWVGLGLKPNNRDDVREADYYGYERYPITSAIQLVGSGFYRLVTTMHFPPRQGGALNASHLLVFDTDRVDPVEVRPLTVLPLPRRLAAPARRMVQLRDVDIDLPAGLFGDWRDADEILGRRLKRAFQQEA